MWHTLQVEVVTPVFSSAGAQGAPHLHTPPEIRVPSLRGGMRFWLRAMAARYVGDDPHLLRKVENRVLGSTEHSSPISLRISGDPQPASQDLSKDMSEDEQTWIGYLLGQAFTKKGKPHTKAYVPPGQEFQIKIRRQQGDDDAVACALAALWLNITYGGVGARVRRGFGRLRITGADITLPVWDSETIRTPALDHYLEAGRTGHIGLDMGLPQESVGALHRVCARASGQTPEAFEPSGPEKTSTLSVLGEGHTIAGLSAPLSASGWHQALARAGKELRYFRAQEDRKHSENPRGPHIKTKGWEDVIGGTSREMPRAALGLPVVYKGDWEVRRSADRRRSLSSFAAPPSVDPSGGTREQWHLFSYAFLNEFLPKTGGSEGERVGLFKKGEYIKGITVHDDDIRTVAKEWTEELAERSDAFSRGRPQ